MEIIATDIIPSREIGKSYKVELLRVGNKIKRQCNCRANVGCWHILAANKLRIFLHAPEKVQEYDRYVALVFGEQWDVIKKETSCETILANAE